MGCGGVVSDGMGCGGVVNDGMWRCGEGWDMVVW